MIVNGAVSVGATTFVVFVFNAAPSSTFTDHAALTIVSGDWGKVAHGGPGTVQVAGTSGYPTVISMVTGTSPPPISIAGSDVWIAIVAAGAVTFSTVSDISICVEGTTH
jgi:hypothetical protein